MSNGTAMSRRGVIAALAAGAAVNLPEIAMTAAAPPVAAAHPDRELLDLGRRYDEALEIEAAALAAWEGASDVYAAAEPAMPNTLRHRPWEHGAWLFPLSPQTRLVSDFDTGDFYCADEIERLRPMRHTRRVGYIVDKATGERREAYRDTPFNEIKEEKHVKIVPDLEAQARAHEILAAWDAHQAACEALPAFEACVDAEGAYYGAVGARKAVGTAIIAARTTTLAGLAVRARIVQGMIDCDDDEPDDLAIDDRMMLAIVRDLAGMAG